MDKIKLGKFLSLVLRHKPESIGLSVDENGWADVDELIKLVNKNSEISLNFDVLCEIVDTNNKKRYSFNEDKTKIRANQGHSIKVDVQLKESIPPNTLYHGTATKYENAIDKEGLISKTRLHVHLSADIETATSVGKRHGKLLIYTVNCNEMLKEGYKFYISENGVWLTENVPVKFLKKL